MLKFVDISVVIPTRNRVKTLVSSLKTLDDQTLLPKEIIIVDGSDDFQSDLSLDQFERIGLNIQWLRANELGAAAQRNQGVSASNGDFVLFMDDDVYLETDVLEKLWTGMNTLNGAGAVNAMIKNQQYTTPGTISRLMYRLMSGERLDSYAGKLIGPAWNLLPEDRGDLPDYVRCEWLNTTCTLYKKESMPKPVFPAHFQGYSFMEDVALSYFVNRKYSLWNCRTARVYHDSQSGDHKSDVAAMSEMELVNRHFVMKNLLNKSKFSDYLKLAVFECFQVITSLASSRTCKIFPELVIGKLRALRKL